MRFLVDTNLPPAVATWLVSEGHEASHTIDLGMAAAKDREIWDAAVASGSCIVTKDEDFVLLKAFDPRGQRSLEDSAACKRLNRPMSEEPIHDFATSGTSRRSARPRARSLRRRQRPR